MSVQGETALKTLWLPLWGREPVQLGSFLQEDLLLLAVRYQEVKERLKDSFTSVSICLMSINMKV